MLSGSDLREFFALGATPESGVAKVRHLMILYESGVDAVCIKTEKPEGRRLRRYLIDEVLPKLRRGEAVLPGAEPPPVFAPAPHASGAVPAGVLPRGHVRFPFDGDELDLVLDADGAHLVLQTACNVLHLNFLDQLAKVRADPAIRVVTKTVQRRSDERPRETACLDLRSVGTWLPQVHPSKADPRTRSRLARYKLGFGEALLDYFHGKRGAASDDHRTLYLHDALRAKWQADNAAMLKHIHREVSETDRAKIEPLRRMTVDLAFRVQEGERGRAARAIRIDPPPPLPPRTGPGRRPADAELGARNRVVSGKLTEYHYAVFLALCEQHGTDGSGLIRLFVEAALAGMVVLPTRPEGQAAPKPKARGARRGRPKPRTRAVREVAKRVREDHDAAREPNTRRAKARGSARAGRR